MQDLPHLYSVAATAMPEGDMGLTSDGVESIASAPPAEFGGPGDRWSPETLLAGAVAGCFILSFRAISRASKLAWTSLTCQCEATLERKDGGTRFTRFVIDATLDVPAGTNEERAHGILQRAEASCLITNSMSGATELRAIVRNAA